MNAGVYTLSDLQQAIAANAARWRPLVFTNGCFDLIHAGHVRYLKAARAMGQALVVGLNSDRSVQALKPATPGQPTRPIIPQAQRAEVLAALRPVDAVVVFDGPTAEHLLRHLQPEFYVKGGDYRLETLPEASTVNAYGGLVTLLPIEVPSSTTAIIHRILEAGVATPT